MRHLIYTGLCLIAFWGMTVEAYAQKSSARATIQPAEILIGDQAVINLEVIAPKGRNILFPAYQDTLITGIEVLQISAPDTVIANEVMTIRQKYVVTSFDSTLYHIAFMPVVDGVDTIKSNSFGLKVSSPILHESVLAYLERLNTQQTDSIDFAQLALSDIKDNLEPPFVWQDYLAYLWVALLIFLLLVLLGLGLYFGLRKKKKGYFFKPQVILPPHVIAIRALDKIKSEKVWQQGLEKQFYTELTDVLREYIEKRFYINAFEKTSDEILDSVKIYAEADSALDSLMQALKLADLVKFAKYKPLPNENDLSLVNSYLFVNQTKIEPPVTDNVQENEEDTDRESPAPLTKANTENEIKKS
ncbi:hypothetical protein [Viscerimonas tarda]